MPNCKLFSTFSHILQTILTLLYLTLSRKRLPEFLRDDYIIDPARDSRVDQSYVLPSIAGEPKTKRSLKCFEACKTTI